MDATRLHSISARSSRARIRAVWTRHATSASLLASPYRDSVSTSWAAASPAKSATFAGATPSSQQAVSPSSSTSSRYSAWALKRDQVARWAGFFSRLNIDLPSGPAVSSSPCARCRPSGPIRAMMPAKIRLVDLSADGGRHLVQRGERRELQRGLDQPLQRHVDQVRRVVLHQRRLADRGLRHRPGPPLVIGHALAVPHLLAVPLGRPRRPVIRLGLRGKSQAVPHVVGDGLGDLLAASRTAPSSGSTSGPPPAPAAPPGSRSAPAPRRPHPPPG